MQHAPAVGGVLSAHRAEKITLPFPSGPIGALHGRPAGTPLATVLMVPGYTGSKEDFAPLLDACTAAGYEVYAIDLPGQNGSPGPAEERAYLPHALGPDVASLIDQFAENGPVLLLGHSYGGLVARAAVLAGAPIAGLTLMASGPARLTDGRRLAALALGEPLLRTDGTEAAYRIREQLSALDPGWAGTPAELRAFLRARFLATGSACLLGMADGLRDEPDRVAELHAALDRAAVPCLVITGEGDDAWSVPEQRAMAATLGAQFALVRHAAHSPNTENPGALLEVLLRTWRTWLA